jgi:hypothetical protein
MSAGSIDVGPSSGELGTAHPGKRSLIRALKTTGRSGQNWRQSDEKSLAATRVTARL